MRCLLYFLVYLIFLGKNFAWHCYGTVPLPQESAGKTGITNVYVKNSIRVGQPLQSLQSSWDELSQETRDFVLQEYLSK